MPDPVIDEIKQRIDIVDFVSQRVQLHKAGRALKGLCPFHQEKTPSFYVYPDQGTYHCFGCGKGGDVFTWLQETERLDFGEALRQLAGRSGVTLPDRAAPPAPDPAAAATADALADAAAWFHDQLLHAADAAPARHYLHRRGLTRETVDRFGIGWAPEKWDALAVALRRKGLAGPQIEAAGLAVAGERGLRDRFRGRVMFPIRDADGRVTGFGGRVLGDASPGQPKYLNSPQTATFDKSATLFALDMAKQAIRKEGCAVIVEGYMDAVVPHQAGFSNVVASLGTALTERQIDLLRRYTTHIVLALDADAAGQAATLRGLEVARQALSERRRPVPGPATRSGYLSLTSGQVRIAVLKGGKDPDEIVREDPEAWRRIVASAVPMVDHKLAVELGRVDPADPQSKAAAVQELARFLSVIPDPIEAAHYVDKIAQRLRVDVRAVQDELDRASRALRDEQRRQQALQRQRPATAGVGGAATESGGAAAGSADAAARGGAPLARPPGAAPPASTTGIPAAGDVTEEHLLTLLVLAPHLLRRMSGRLAPEDFQRPECRELYRVILALAETGTVPASEPAIQGAWPQHAAGAGEAVALPEGTAGAGGAGADPVRRGLDTALLAYYDRIVTRARRQPAQTESQLEADLAGVSRRIKERNLHVRLQEAQYLLTETEAEDERIALKRQVEWLAGQLLRVQLEQSRTALYTAPPN